MARTTYNVEGVGKVTVTDADYLGAGGEATIYIKDNLALKIYHSPDQMIPTDKIKELKQISDPLVLIPKHIIFEGAKPVGYAMDYKPDTHPLCKIFTKAFKSRSKISDEMINALVEQMQKTVHNIHFARCLCVDLNEMNEMVSPCFSKVYFIDVDSYETPSYHATAIMESIRDRKVTGNKWTEGSDWFSFAILAFQMWIGIHPYKGRHPDYKPGEWIKRMEDGVSVFDPKVALPLGCSPMSIIPKSHLAWLKDIFVNNARLAPPSMGDMISVSVPQAFKFITASKSFEVSMVEECVENIKDAFDSMGIIYLIGEKRIYKNKTMLPVDISTAKKVVMADSQGNDPVIAILKDGTVTFSNIKGQNFGVVAAKDMMARNGHVYTVHDGRLYKNSVIRVGEKLLHSAKTMASVMDLTTQVYRGAIVQDILGKKYVTIPYSEDACANVPVKELDKYRVLDARSERNVCVIMAERKGKYSRFVLTFDADFKTYTIRAEDDVPYADANITVLPNGVAIMATDDSVEIFKDSNVKIIDSPPFDATMKIFNLSGSIHYIDGKSLNKVKMK